MPNFRYAGIIDFVVATTSEIVAGSDSTFQHRNI